MATETTKSLSDGILAEVQQLDLHIRSMVLDYLACYSFLTVRQALVEIGLDCQEKQDQLIFVRDQVPLLRANILDYIYEHPDLTPEQALSEMMAERAKEEREDRGR